MDYDPESDLRVLEAMASNLTPYLYEDALYGTLSPNLPKLTVGALHLRLHRLQALEGLLSFEQQARLRDAAMNFEQQRAEWKTHYQNKLAQEIPARLRNFKAYLDDYDESAAQARAGYPAEAAHRTMIHHLQAEARNLDLWQTEWGEELRKQDSRLRMALGDEAGHFIWAEAIAPAYDEEAYWWLYNFPKED